MCRHRQVMGGHPGLPAVGVTPLDTSPVEVFTLAVAASGAVLSYPPRLVEAAAQPGIAVLQKVGLL